MTNPIDDEAVYRVVVEEKDHLSGRPLGVWPALIAEKLKVDKTKVRPALLRLQDAGRVHEIYHNWYPGARPECLKDRIHHPETMLLMLTEAWAFIVNHHPREEWPPFLCESVDEFRERFPGILKG